MTDLSVVIITKNQLWNVDRLVGSVLREIADVPAAEVLLVDSGSEDGTPERAAQHPIGVLCLLPDQPLTAALGRYVGGRETTGELVLFLDGDMELCPGWLDRALRTMDERTDVAAVAGTVVDVPVDTPGTTGHWPDDVVAAWRRDPVPREITNTGGAALHRRSVLEATGSFHPFLRSEEEPELCLRIRDAGYRVLHLDTPVALHYSTPARTVGTLLARRRRRLYEGMGQVMRHHVGTPLGRTYLRERGYGLVPGLGVLVGAGALATGIGARRWWPFALWATALSSTVGIHAARRRSVGDAMFSLMQRACIVEGTVRGFVTEPVVPEAHPARFEVVQPIPVGVPSRR
jgi:GT2 family glycosyltransferase